MTAAPDSRPVDERLRAAIDELHAASVAQAREGTASDPYPLREFAVGSLRRAWDEIPATDERWQAINALLSLDQPSAHAEMRPPAQLAAMHANLVEFGAALLDIDADLGEGNVRWMHMRQLKLAIDALPALYASLEDELAAVKS